MRLTEKILDVRNIFISGSTIFYSNGKKLTNSSNLNSIEILNLSGLRKSKEIIAVILDEKVVFYDTNLVIVITIENQSINNESGLTLIDEENFIIHNFDVSDNILIFKSGIIVSETSNFWGWFLNENYRINYLENTFGNPKYFRCSDLLDEKTYWEYTCPPGLQASNTWVVRGEYLLFCENTDGSYQGNIKKIHLPTGELKWEAAVPMTRLHYNESQGLFISFWANVDYGQYYQIIDIDNETLEFGNPITDVILQNLPSTEGTLYLYERKLYFTDFSNVYGDQIPKIMLGCFDIDTKEVEFLQEVPEAKGDGFAQVIYSDNKLYLRSFGNKLYVYEHEITAS